jgi:hypothetical protein
MLSLLTLLMLAGTAAQASSAAPDAADLMARLSRLELSAGDVREVRNLTLRRDVVSVSFTRGIIAFLEPVDGRVTGAFFLGAGEVLAIPPDEVERRQMDRFTGSPILNERFDAAFLRFTDGTYREVLDAFDRSSPEPVRAADLQAFEAQLPWGENLGERSRFLNFRLFRDLAGAADRPVFFAALRGQTLGWFDVTYDQRSVEEVAVTGRRPPDGVPAVWASFNERGESGDPTLYGREWDAEYDIVRYEIDTTIRSDGTLESLAEVSIVALKGGERVLEFGLTPSLVVDEVRLGGQPVSWFQHPASSPVRPGSERLLVVLPRPVAEGEELRLEFAYSGPVLERRGNGVFYVNERVFWYPRAPALDLARYDLTFHYPPEHVLVATGEKLGQTVENGQVHSVWTSEGDFVVAGFNYGDFTVESDEGGTVPIYVHVNNDVEAVFEELSAGRAASTEQALEELSRLWGWRRRAPPPPVPAAIVPDYDLFSTRRLAANVAGQVRSILDSFTSKLGAYPFGRLSVSQFPADLSQGWPSLLYVSTSSFFDTEQRARLGMVRTGGGESVLAHEIAHQWFGNTVSWRSYRDQWIGEGFANYLALLYTEERDPARFRTMLSELAERLLRADRSGRAYEELGPLWLGRRLSSPAAPDGYGEVVYPKATWVLHMLRMMMREESPEASAPDVRFIAMMREFLDTYRGGPATTWDLMEMAERHMSARMDLEGDGTLGWFFDQWVFRTGVPEFFMESGVVGQGGAFAVEGRIDDRLGLGFSALVPVYARMDSGDLVRLGDVAVTGGAGSYRFTTGEPPVEVVMDPYRTVLRK